MAYFSNGSEGSVLAYECQKCILGDEPCPITFVHCIYNYEQIGNELARNILNELVKQDRGAPWAYHGCQMKKLLNEKFSGKAAQDERRKS